MVQLTVGPTPQFLMITPASAGPPMREKLNPTELMLIAEVSDSRPTSVCRIDSRKG